MILNILLIAVCVVIITDLTDFWDYFKRFLYGIILKRRITTLPHVKLLDCSLCQTFWIGLFYILFNKQMNILSVSYVLFVAFMTGVIRDIIVMIKDIMVNLIGLIYKILRLK